MDERRHNKDKRRGSPIEETERPALDLSTIFAASVAGTRNCMLVTDVTLPDQPIVFANPAFLELTGYALGDILGRNLRLLRGPGTDAEAARRIDAALASGEPLDIEALNYRKDGTPFWTELSLTPVRTHGTVTHFVEILVDATQRHLAEERARASEERLKDFAAAASDWLWEMDGDLRYTYFSGKLTTYTGVDPALMVGKRRQDLLSAEDLDSEFWQKHLEDLRAHRPFRDLVYRATLPNGVRHWVRVSGQPFHDANGRFLGYRGVGTDVTEQIEAEQRAKSANDRLIEALGAIPAGISLWDAEDRLIFRNDHASTKVDAPIEIAIPGMTFEETVRRLAASGQFAYAGEALEKFIAARLAGHRKPSNVEEIANKDNRWIQVVEKRLSDGGSIKCAVDITEIRRREQELAAQTRVLRTTFESIDQGIAVFDPEQRLVAWNDRYQLLIGLPDELMREGTSIRSIIRHMADQGDLGPGDPALLAESYFEDRARSYGQRRLVTRRSGLALEVTVSQTPDGGSVAVIGDVTERIGAERRAEAAHQNLIDVLNAVPAVISLWGPDDRLLFINSNAQANWNAYSGIAKPGGAPFEQVVRETAALGEYAYEGEELQRFIKTRIAGHRLPSNTIEIALSDGRFINQVERRLRDGSSVKCATDITDIRRREQDFAQQSRILRTTLDSMAEGIAVFDANGIVVAFNPQYPALLEFPVDFLKVGTSLQSIALKAAQRGDYGPGDPEELARRFLAEREQSFGKRRRVHRKSGASAEILAYRTPDGGSVTLVADVTRRVWSERLRDSDRQILEHIARDDAVESVLQALCLAVEGFEAGSRCTIRRQRIGAQPAEPASPNCWNTPIVGGDAQLLGTIEVTLAPGKQPDERGRQVLEHATYLARIAIEKSLAEDRQRLLEERLRQAQRLQSLGNLAGGIAHEINNSLLPIVTLAEMALEAQPPGSIEPANAKIVHDSAIRIEGLVKKVLAFSGAEVRERQRLDLADCVREALRVQRLSLHAGIALTDDLGSDPLEVVADVQQIRQVVDNLVGNAVQAIAERAGQITVAVHPVAEAAAAPNAAGRARRFCRLRVSDDGPGIPDAIKARLFDPFFTTSEVGSGVGLGLSIVYGIVNALGGHIEVDSAPGSGTSFAIFLPLADADSPPLSASKGAEPSNPSPQTPAPRVERTLQ